MEKFKKKLVCWKKNYSAQKELTEIENGIKPEENEWYKGAESAITIKIILDENTIKKELENMKKIEKWAKKL